MSVQDTLFWFICIQFNLWNQLATCLIRTLPTAPSMSRLELLNVQYPAGFHLGGGGGLLPSLGSQVPPLGFKKLYCRTHPQLSYSQNSTMPECLDETVMRIQYVCEAHSSQDSEVVSVFILGQQSAKVLGTLYIMRESQTRYIFTSGNKRESISLKYMRILDTTLEV